MPNTERVKKLSDEIELVQKTKKYGEEVGYARGYDTGLFRGLVIGGLLTSATIIIATVLFGEK